ASRGLRARRRGGRAARALRRAAAGPALATAAVMEPGSPRRSAEVPRGRPAEPYRFVIVVAPPDGVRALAHLLRRLPADLAAPVALLQHRPSCVPDLLGTVLSRIAALSVTSVGPHGIWPERGHLYIAPVDHCLEVDAGGRLTAAAS